MLALTTGATAGYALLRPRSVVSTVALPPVTSFPPVPQDAVLPAQARVPRRCTRSPSGHRGSCAGAACDHRDGPRRRGPRRHRDAAPGSCAVRDVARVPTAHPGFTAREGNSAYCPPSVPHSPASPPGSRAAYQRTPTATAATRGQHNAATTAAPAAAAAAQRASGDHPSRRPAGHNHAAHHRATRPRARHHPSTRPDMTPPANEPAAHATMFHFVKQPRYYAAVDEVREPQADSRTPSARTGKRHSERTPT